MLWAPVARTEGWVRLSIDVKDADATEVVTVLARAADKQPVFQPGISCRLTLRTRDLEWRATLDAVLTGCRMGVEEEGSVMRIAPLEQLTRERAELAARQAAAGAPAAPTTVSYRLKQARVAELCPILQKLLPKGQVSYDARTNTLFITY